MTGPKPKPHLLKISPYIAGEDSVPGVRNPAKLSSNESPLGPSPKALEAYTKTADALHRYPNGGAQVLRDALAEKHSFSADRIVCGNGSEQLIDMLARAYAGPGDEVVFSRHAFVCYYLSTLAAEAVPVIAEESNLTADVDTILDAVTGRTRIIFLANPNNPTGTHLPFTEISRLRQSLPEEVMLVIDAAYCEYVGDSSYSAGDGLVDDTPGNTVVLRTFSKIHGLAALRVGWAYCSSDTALVLHRVRGVFNVSTPAQRAAVASLGDEAHIRNAREHNDVWLPWVASELTRLGLQVTPSAGNFVLAHFADAAQCAAADAYLRSHGIILRPVANYGFPAALRVSVGLDAENRKLLELLGTFIDEEGRATGSSSG